MSVEDSKAVVRRYIEILGTDVEAPDAFATLGEVIAEEYANRSGTEGPWSILMQGRDPSGFSAWWEEQGRDHPTRRFVIDDIIGEGDKVAIRLTRFEKGKPTANQIVMFRLAGGKIVDDWYCARDLD